MSNSNGLTSTPGVFFSGNVNSNVYIRNPAPELVDAKLVDAELINPVVKSNIQFQSATEVGEIGFDSAFGVTGRIGITAQNSILFVPNILSGAATDGIVFQDGTTQSSMVIIPSSANIQLVSQSIPGFNTITLTNPGSAVGMGASNTGVINFIQIVASGNYNIQFLGSNCVPGTIWDFFVAGSLLAGTQAIVFENGSTAITTVVPNSTGPDEIPVGTVRPIRIFTPDGTSFLLVK